MSQPYLQQRPPPHQQQRPPPQQQQRNSRMQTYNMDQIPRPRPPPHYSQQPRPMQQQPRMQSPNYQPTRGPYQPARQPTQPRMQGRPMRPPPPQPPLIGRRSTMNRARSLSRPERQRPRQGMFRSPSQQQRLQYHVRPPMQQRPSQPMSNSLQHQLQQQKLQQQQEAIQPVPVPAKLQKKEPEENVKVLTNWWAWIAFIMTCCVPNWFLKVCLRKRNSLVQQAWREKVTKKPHKTKHDTDYLF